MLNALHWTSPPAGASLTLLDTTTVGGKERQAVTAYQGAAEWTVTISNASIAVTGPLTDAQLRATPVEVAQAKAGTAGSVSEFSSETSAQILAADADRVAVTIYNRGAGTLLVLMGTGTASAANSTVRVEPGDLLRIGPDLAGLAMQGLFLSAGTANVQAFS